MRDERYPAPAEMNARIDAIEQRAAELVRDLDQEQLRQRPSSGGWSVGQLLEHLVASWDAYARELAPLLARTDLRAGDPNAWSPGLIGGFLLRSMVSRRRLPAPRVFRPVREPGIATLTEFLRTTRELREMIGRAQGLDWNALRLRSPVSPLIRLRLGAALAIQVLHAERHLGQAERVKTEIRSRSR